MECNLNFCGPEEDDEEECEVENDAESDDDWMF